MASLAGAISVQGVEDCTAEARRTQSKEFLIKNNPNSANSVSLCEYFSIGNPEVPNTKAPKSGSSASTPPKTPSTRASGSPPWAPATATSPSPTTKTTSNNSPQKQSAPNSSKDFPPVNGTKTRESETKPSTAASTPCASCTRAPSPGRSSPAPRPPNRRPHHPLYRRERAGVKVNHPAHRPQLPKRKKQRQRRGDLE